MTRFAIGAIITVGVLLCVCGSGVSRAEDGLFLVGIDCGGSCGNVLEKTRPNSFVPAIPGGTFVITVAHVAPSPEAAIVHGVPATCDPVRFRVDRLKVKTEDGQIEVELGERQRLAAGEATRIMYQVSPDSGAGLPTYDLDLMGFRFRSEPASSRCSIVASGLFYGDSSTTSPIPVALIPSVGPSPEDSGPTGGRLTAPAMER